MDPFVVTSSTETRLRSEARERYALIDWTAPAVDVADELFDIHRLVHPLADDETTYAYVDLHMKNLI